MTDQAVLRELSGEESEFVERMGRGAQADGMARIAGRIWGALIVCDEPVTSSQLAQLLQISKGSVSSNTRVLESLDIIDRGYRPGSRQEYFSMKSKPYQTLIEGQIARLEQSIGFIASSRDYLKGDQVQHKLCELEEFYTLYRSACMKLVKQLGKGK